VFEGKHPLIGGAYYLERSSPSFDDKLTKYFFRHLQPLAGHLLEMLYKAHG
jgi:hypothetical protein